MAKNKTAIAIAMLLTLTISLSILPLVYSQEGVSKNTFAIVSALPDPVGVGQETLILTGITHATAWPQPGWYNVRVELKLPDGSSQTLGPVTTDTTGMTGIKYVPTVAGTYQMRTHFPQQKIEYTAAGTLANTTMKESYSDWVDLIVTQEPREYYPGVPLPSFFWTRPINAEFREWDPIAGNWLGVRGYDNRLPPANDDAPETGHILWTRPYAEGGLVGGVDLDVTNMDMISYEHGDAYEGKFSNPVIMNGILFYTQHAAQSAMPAFGGTGYEVEQKTVAIDLHTGKELWNRVLGNNERQAFGQIMYWKTMNMYGAFSYLWTTVGSTWNAYDPFTGRWEYTITGVPSGSRTVGPNGEILVYTMDNNRGWMTMWNSTATVYRTYMDYYLSRPSDAPVADYYSGRWRPHGLTFNASKGIQWNVTIPMGLPTGGPSSNIQTVVGNDRILGSNTNWAGGAAQPNPVFWAVSIKPGQEGRLLFNRSWTLPMADVHVDIPGSEPASLEDGVFVVSVKELRTHYGFSLDTGEQIWGPTSPAEPYLSVFTSLYMNPWGAAVIKYGKLYTAGMSGVVNAYNVKTGEHLWRYNITDPYTEQLFSSNWPAPINFIVDGKIYLFHQEHSANTPVPRGAPAVCLDAETGEVVWRTDGLRLGTRWGGQPAIGDSIIAAFSSYDNQVVALGKGPTKTTVTAPDAGVPFGTSVTIKGTVMDVSPGTENADIKLRFPNGVAAITDEYMDDWMRHVYMQFPAPVSCKGTEVTISVVDANLNSREIGKATSDTSGFYSLSWTPDIPGHYTVVATFGGSKSYWSSYAETAFTVDELVPPPETPGQPPSNTDTYVLAGIAATIAAIAIVGALILLSIRKKH